MDAPLNNSPYLELREFFRLCEKSSVSLTFQQIEKIIGDTLPPEAFLFDAFWFENLPGMPSPMWRDEGFPFRTLSAAHAAYCISDTWTSQGYELKTLHRTEARAVFRRTVRGKAGWMLPKALLDGKLPEKHVYGLNKVINEYMKNNGL